MRRLILFRHAEAERSEPGASDHARVLSEHGRKEAALVGAYLGTHALVPEHIMVSTAARTQETWKHAAAEMSAAPEAEPIERLYDAMPGGILEVVMQAPPSAHSLLVVGHNPGLHDLALMLVASGDIVARERLREKLPTGGLVVIDFPLDAWSKLHPHAGRLERFVSPKMLITATN